MDKWDLMLHAELEKTIISLDDFVARCCFGLNIDPLQVIDNLLSLEDRQDIINGDISHECLRAHIEAWITQGMPYYATRICKSDRLK
jgi:hypothetical protein